MKREQSILIRFSILLITTVLFNACSQPPSSGNSSVSPQAEMTSSSQTSQSTAEPDAGQLASAAAVTPTMTPEADPRNELGSSTWALFLMMAQKPGFSMKTIKSNQKCVTINWS